MPIYRKMTLSRAVQSLVENNRGDHILFLQVSHLVKEIQWKCTQISRTKLSLWRCLLLSTRKLTKKIFCFNIDQGCLEGIQMK